MRPYKSTGMFQETFDLDDETTYANLPNEEEELTNRMWKNIGFALSYMDFIHRDLYPMDSRQRIRVTELIAKFWREGREDMPDGDMKRGDVRWLKEQIFIFEDETENMC